MKINAYLAEMEPAIRHVVAEVHRERAELERLEAAAGPLEQDVVDGYWRADWFALNPEFDDEGIGTASYWATYYGADKELVEKQQEISEADSRIVSHMFSTSALAGTLLQFAKQGIALRFGREREKAAPAGRIVAGMPLHEVVWQARNQALHWEEGRFSPKVERCFEALAGTDPRFGEYKKRSLAFEIISLLTWSTYERVRDDLLLLDP